MKAHVLIETGPGKMKYVRQALQRIRRHRCTILSLEAVTGPYDFIMTVEGPTLDAIGGVVTEELGMIEEVTRTTTCLVVTI